MSTGDVVRRARGLTVLLWVAIVIGLLAGATTALACSVFCLSTESGTVVGRNLDWHDIPGIVLVNPRGIEKRVLPWEGDWPTTHDGPDVVWTSRYGSVTFTCYGRDFIESGMNEAGLVVTEASLESAYAAHDGRPGWSCAQWLQYQLDNYATVSDVLEHIEDLRVDGEGWHFLFADASGDCAVIEHEGGRIVVYSEDEAPVCALTNTSYARAQSHVPLDLAFGGELDIGSGDDSYGRFVRMAALVRDHVGEESSDATDYAVRVLDEVSSEDTRRSIVFDTAAMRVRWTTGSSVGATWLEFGSVDFAAGAPVMMVDVNIGAVPGLMVTLIEYSEERNRAIVSAVMDARSGTDDLGEVLAARGLTYAGAFDLIAAHPTAPSDVRQEPTAREAMRDDDQR